MALGDLLFPRAELKLLIVRSFKSDVESAKGIKSENYLKESALVQLNNNDMRRLSLKEDSHVSVKSSAGLVIVRVSSNEKTPEGHAVMPHSPWALALVAIPKDESPPALHGLSITITRSEEDITSLEELLHS